MSALASTLLVLYRKAQEVPLEAFQPVALDLLRPLLRFDSARWGAATFTDAGVKNHGACLFNEPAEMLQVYEEVKHEDIAAFALWKGKSGLYSCRYHAPTLFRAPNKKGIREYTRRFGHQNAVIVALERSADSFVQYVSLYRARDDAQYAKRDTAAAQVLFLHLIEAQRINLAVRATQLHGLFFLRARTQCAADRLTRRELQVAQEIVLGRSHKEIARLLGVSPATVRGHIQRIHDRLGVHNNAELAAKLEAADR